MKNYDLTTKKKTFCVKHKKHCTPVTGSWIFRDEGWECSDSHIPYPEFVPESVHKDRVTYASDQLQSHRGGNLSREFVEVNPGRIKKMIKEGALTKKEVKDSKYVWKEVKGWEKGKKVDADMLVK